MGMIVGGRGVRFIYFLLGVVVRERRKTRVPHLKRDRGVDRRLVNACIMERLEDLT
jgi:hypothetical protein